jgi:tripartite-type tricarboxylate transporter receptor subunit TctC
MLQEKIGQAFIVENKTGASGTVGGQYAARAEPDGYTLFANSVADTQNLHYMPVSYSAVDDFTQIGFIVEGPALLLVIDAKLPYKTLDELLTEARINPSKVTFGTSGPAASPALSLNQLNALAKTQIVGVPYRGVGEAAQAAAAGIIQGTFVFYSQAKSLAEQGKVRALAIASPTRITTWPEVPTLRELGYDIDGRGFVGLAAPAKTPKPIIAFLNARLNEVVQSDTFKSRMGELGMAPPPDNTPEHLDAFLRGEIAHQGELAKLSGEALKR